MRLTWADFELDEERFELRRGGTKVPVQPKVLELLLTLVRARDRVVLRRELFDTIWAGVAVSEASLSRAVLEARRVIGDELQQVLVTVRGRGFRFAAEVVARPPEGRDRDTGPTDPTFVGRESQLTCLMACLDEARRGHGTLAWISGEAGIGKTRTADEFARRARLRGAAVYAASAHEAPPAPPFWLFAQVARAYAAAGGAQASRVLEATTPPLAGDRDPASEFTRFDAFARCFIEAAALVPQIFVFDDVHWADDGSQRLLRFFAREVRRAAVVIVCTYRDTQETDSPRARAFGALLGECAGLSVPLRGLSPDDVPRFVDVTTGTAPSESLARSLYERTGGNPLYLRQVLQTEWAQRALTEAAHQLASSMDLQQGLVESIQRHLQGVSGEGRELLTVAAVLGREFTFTELLAVSGVEQAPLLDRLDEGVRARILIRSKSGAYSFTHALVQDVLYKSLSSADRAAMHAVVGQRLLTHYGASLDAHVEVLALHYSRALPGGDPERAFELSARAAKQASAASAHDVAARHWGSASEALAHLAPDDARHVEARLGAAAAHALAGESDRARAAFVDAATLARTFGNAAAIAEAALGFARVADRGSATRRQLLAEARTAVAGAPGDAAAEAVARIDALLESDARAGR
jgi:predicted ATPase/DNA-binding winged helix-turn-helix (wHTH) protein